GYKPFDLSPDISDRNVVSIFISHAWSESAVYERSVDLIDESLGRGKWRNVSIPSSEAIDLCKSIPWSLEAECDRLEDELIRIEAELRRPNLPDAITRFVWDAAGQCREEATVGTLR